MESQTIQQQLDQAINYVSELIGKVEELQSETESLRAEKDQWMKQALANQQLHEGMVKYYHKTREILKKYYTKYADLRREMNDVKPPKLS